MDIWIKPGFKLCAGWADHFLVFSHRDQLLPVLKDCSVPDAERRGDWKILNLTVGLGPTQAPRP